MSDVIDHYNQGDGIHDPYLDEDILRRGATRSNAVMTGFVDCPPARMRARRRMGDLIVRGIWLSQRDQRRD